MLKERVLAPLIAVALVVGVGAVAWSTRSHRRPGPLVMTIVGSIAIACGRLVWIIQPLVYLGGVVLLGASLWNLWLKRSRSQPLVAIRLGRSISAKRSVEVFSIGCPRCDEAVKIVQSIASAADDVQIHDTLSDKAAQAKAAQYGIKRMPAVVVNGRLADCCKGGDGVDAATLRTLGVGQP